ncbi:MAG: acyltransferase [Actinomycetota bacterium]|nr:acyltransferase [Actinomycetota bacterium]
MAAITPPPSPPVHPRLAIGATFQVHRNSLNFLRLVLALAVVFSHAITIGLFGSENFLGKTTLGTLAVYGFFGISGYLIAGSAERNHVGRYLWQRVLRIFPAFWTCMFVTAFVFGTVVWYHANPLLASRCGVSCYLSEPGGPVGYFLRNLWIQAPQSTIAHTLPLGYFRPVWNGSVWTLYFECMCYVLLAVLSVAGLLRHRLAVALLAATIWLTEIVITSVPQFNQHFSPSDNWDAMKLLTFVPVFLGGSLLYLYRDRVPDSGLLALACALAFLSGLVLPLGNSTPAFTLTSTDLTSVFLAYPLLWLGIHLPLHQVGARNDYSYGVYIYAFPVQQLLVNWGANRWGYWPYAFLSVAAVAPVAAASWWVVERHALRLKTVRWPLPTRLGQRASEDPRLE